MRSQRQNGMHRTSHTESVYKQAVPNKKNLMSRFFAFKFKFKDFNAVFRGFMSDFRAFTRISYFTRLRAFMFRLSCVHVQTFVRSPEFQISPDFVRFWSDFRAFMSRLSCVHQNFILHQTSCVYVKTFVRSPELHTSPDFRAFMSRLSCVHQSFVLLQTSCVYVQTFVRSCPDFRALIRFSCVHVQTFVRSCLNFVSFFFLFFQTINFWTHGAPSWSVTSLWVSFSTDSCFFKPVTVCFLIFKNNRRFLRY